jgi:hypothetical protein
MRGLVASPAARLATATATASDGPQGHLRPLKQPEVFWSDWIQRTCNRLGDITSVHDVPETYCSAEGRNHAAQPQWKPHRHGHRLERLSLRVHHEEADSECPRFQSAVIQPPLLQLTATALWPRSSEGSSVREQAKWLSKHLRGAVALVICR